MKHKITDKAIEQEKIEKKNPLKQGLKLISTTFGRIATTIEKKNPLKQGLKLRREGDEVLVKVKLKRRIH